MASCIALFFWANAATAYTHSTSDAPTWTLLTEKAPWMGRTQVAVHSTLFGRLYSIGGRSWHFSNEVWASDNGTDWELLAESSAWGPRAYHAVGEIDGSLILTGGSSWGRDPRQVFLRFFSDVWRSDDRGKTWHKIADNAPWGLSPDGKQLGRGGHFQVVVNGTLLVMGGNYAEVGQTYYGDVWRSDDKGATWTCVNNRTEWFARVAHQVVVMPDDALVLVGGDNFRLGNYTSATDVWRSEDMGVSWTKVSETPFSPRSGNKCVLYHDDIVCVGGITGKPRDGDFTGICPHKSSCLLNDVWKSADAGVTWTQIATKGWGCTDPEGKNGCGRFDFGMAVKDDEIYTIGGDEETTYPDEVNSVWKFYNPPADDAVLV